MFISNTSNVIKKKYPGQMMLVTSLSLAFVHMTNASMHAQGAGFDELNSATKSQIVKRDPTRPPNYVNDVLSPVNSPEPEFQLSAIFTRNNQQYAIVNGDVVKAGDMLNGMLVSEIGAHSLTLRNTNNAQHTTVLKMHGLMSVKKQVVK